VNERCEKPAIALFIGWLCGGGAEKVLVHLARGFVARGFSVDFLLLEVKGPYLSMLPGEVRIVDLGGRSVLRALPRLVGYLRRERPCAMISSLHRENVYALAAKFLSGSDVRLLARVECNLGSLLANERSLLKRLQYRAASWAYRFADRVIAVSRGVAVDLQRNRHVKWSKIQCVYNPIVDEDLFRKAEEPVNMPFLADRGLPLILAVGRLSVQKDYPTLVRAFAGLRKKRPCRLLILGEGEERGAIERMVHELHLDDDVFMPGFVDNPFAWMKKADLFVLSSAWEGFGNVLVEAMACGVPAVSTDCPSGPSEILEEGRWGRLVPVGDADALAAAMEESLAAGKYPDVRSRAMEFTVDKAVEAHLDLIPECFR